MKSIAEAAAEAKQIPEDTFEPARYPYIYAYDLLIGWHDIIPRELLNATQVEMLADGYALPRGAVITILREWAARTGMDELSAAVLLADRYIELTGIDAPAGARNDAIAEFYATA